MNLINKFSRLSLFNKLFILLLLIPNIFITIFAFLMIQIYPLAIVCFGANVFNYACIAVLINLNSD